MENENSGRGRFFLVVSVVFVCIIIVAALVVIGRAGNKAEPDEVISAEYHASTVRPTATPIQPSPPPLGVPTSLPFNPVLGDRWVRPSDSMDILFVPGGAFMMGSDPAVDPDAKDSEQPQHEVTLDGFWIDRTEVTNEQYRLCLQDGSCVDGIPFNGRYYHYEMFKGDSQPLVGISWFEAGDYCRWAGAGLPTEAQWEYAARGNDGRLYPWGNEFDMENVNGCDVNCPYNFERWEDYDYDDGYEFSAPVGSFPGGASWVGAVDMSGNVWEWVADWYDADYYANSPDRNPTGPQNGFAKVVRGGSWNFLITSMRSASRTDSLPINMSGNTGFRCAVPGR